MRSILLVSPHAAHAGAERAIAGIARRLPDHGFRPTVVVLEPGPAEPWFADAGCRTVVLERSDTPLERTVSAVERIVRSTKSTVVVSNKWQGHMVGGAAAGAAGVPAVWWQHDIAEPNEQQTAAASIAAAAIVCTGDYAAAAQRRLTPETPIEKIPPGSAVTEIARHRGSGGSVRRLLGWEANSIIGIVGRLEPWKGQHTFLEAAATVAQLRPECRFAVVGDDLLGNHREYPKYLRRLAHELGLADRVHFAGHQEAVYGWFDALDIVVHATYGEPFGLVVVEAMALRKPVIASTPGGPEEIVEDGVSGLLVPANRPEALARSLQRLLDDPGLAARLADAGQRRALLFSDDATAAQFAALLARILDAN